MNANAYKVGQVVNAVSATVDLRRTEPPQHYTEYTLLADMLGAHKFATTDADREMLKTISGIGTSRTRGKIIKGFVERGFLVRQKKGKRYGYEIQRYEIRISEAGKQLLQGLPPYLQDVTLTAKWEKALQMVAQGQASAEQLRAKVETILREQIPALLKTAGPVGK